MNRFRDEPRESSCSDGGCVTTSAVATSGINHLAWGVSCSAPVCCPFRHSVATRQLWRLNEIRADLENDDHNHLACMPGHALQAAARN